MRGAGGPVGVTVPTETDDETVQLFLESAQKAGWGFVEDLNAQDEQQVGFTPSTIKNGIRQSTANTFLWAARHRKNLTIATHTTVGRLRFDGNRVVGVTARRGDRLIDYTARNEVIISAGAIETPMLLERSGIGRGDVLGKAGVDATRGEPERRRASDRAARGGRPGPLQAPDREHPRAELEDQAAGTRCAVPAHPPRPRGHRAGTT